MSTRVPDAQSPLGRDNMPAWAKRLFSAKQLGKGRSGLAGEHLLRIYVGRMPKKRKDRPGVTAAEAQVLVALITALPYTGRGFHSYEALASETGLSRSTVGEALRFWKELGVVETLEKGDFRGRANDYQLHWPSGPVTVEAVVEARERIAAGDPKKRRPRPAPAFPSEAGSENPAPSAPAGFVSPFPPPTPLDAGPEEWTPELEIERRRAAWRKNAGPAPVRLPLPDALGAGAGVAPPPMDSTTQDSAEVVRDTAGRPLEEFDAALAAAFPPDAALSRERTAGAQEDSSPLLTLDNPEVQRQFEEAERLQQVEDKERQARGEDWRGLAGDWVV